MESRPDIHAAEPVPVESGHEIHGLRAVRDTPQGHDDPVGAGQFEGALQAVDPFAPFDLPAAGIAGGEDGQAGVRQVEVGDLIAGEDAVFVARQGRVAPPGSVGVCQE